VEVVALAPAPDIASLTGEARLELPMDNVPATLPLPVGRKASLNSKVWPGASETPEDRPAVENAEFDRAAELMVSGTLPVFLRLIV
jgi:hypothetical protein